MYIGEGEKKLPTWKCSTLSSEGKMILIETTLSSIPITQWEYLLQGEAHLKMDTSRDNFFQHGPGLKEKYYMARWAILAKPKEADGLGFKDTRVMN